MNISLVSYPFISFRFPLYSHYIPFNIPSSIIIPILGIAKSFICHPCRCRTLKRSNRVTNEMKRTACGCGRAGGLSKAPDPWRCLWDFTWHQYISGWWLTYPSEKYDFVSWDDEIPNIWKNNKCSTPPTSIYLYRMWVELRWCFGSNSWILRYQISQSLYHMYPYVPLRSIKYGIFIYISWMTLGLDAVNSSIHCGLHLDEGLLGCFPFRFEWTFNKHPYTR